MRRIRTRLPASLSPHVLAASAIAFAFALDVIIKRWILGHAGSWNDSVLVPGLLDLHYAYNRGISFSLFWQADSFGSGVLAALLLVVIIGFAVAAFRTRKPLAAAGLGLIVGGALGNMSDRYFDGAVFDFLVLRIGRIALFVFNSADFFITLGAVLFIADAIFSSDEPKTP